MDSKTNDEMREENSGESIWNNEGEGNKEYLPYIFHFQHNSKPLETSDVDTLKMEYKNSMLKIHKEQEQQQNDKEDILHRLKLLKIHFPDISMVLGHPEQSDLDTLKMEYENIMSKIREEVNQKEEEDFLKCQDLLGITFDSCIGQDYEKASLNPEMVSFFAYFICFQGFPQKPLRDSAESQATNASSEDDILKYDELLKMLQKLLPDASKRSLEVLVQKYKNLKNNDADLSLANVPYCDVKLTDIPIIFDFICQIFSLAYFAQEKEPQKFEILYRDPPESQNLISLETKFPTRLKMQYLQIKAFSHQGERCCIF